jgi:hypothetical protein
MQHKHILINDLLHIKAEELDGWKIRFVKPSFDKYPDFDPYENYTKDPLMQNDLGFKFQNTSLKKGDKLIGLLALPDNDNKWKVVNICEVVNDKGPIDQPIYELSPPLEEYSKYIGRVVIDYKLKQGEQNLVQNFAIKKDELVVHQITPSEDISE